MAGSLIIILGALLPGHWGAVLFFGVVLLMVVVPIIFSYLEYKKTGLSS